MSHNFPSHSQIVNIAHAIRFLKQLENGKLPEYFICSVSGSACHWVEDVLEEDVTETGERMGETGERRRREEGRQEGMGTKERMGFL